MRIVSENSELDLRKREAIDRLAARLKELAANMLRVVRGAGRSSELIFQMEEVLTAYGLYQEVHGHPPPRDVLNAILNVPMPDEEMRSSVKQGRVEQSALDRWEADGEMDRLRAEAMICRGALQAVASHLAGQLTQQRNGESELYDGIRALGQAQRRGSAAKKPAPKPKRRRP